MRRSSKRSKTGAGSRAPEIDERTEMVLRQALEPSSVTTPAPAATAAQGSAASAAPPVAARVPAPGPAALRPARPDRPDRPDRPQRPPRPQRAKVKGLTPVTVDDPHYHQEPQPADHWVPEEQAFTTGELAAGAYRHLRSLMVELPVKAGTGEVQDHLEAVARATLDYYRYGLSLPEGESLPVGVTDGAQSSMGEDIHTLAGYLELESRFGRVPDAVEPGTAAARLMRDLASRALDQDASDEADDRFLQHAVRSCLEGEASAPPAADPAASAPPAADPAAAGSRPGGQPERLVYRRGGVTPGPANQGPGHETPG